MNDAIIRNVMDKFSKAALEFMPQKISTIYLYGSCARGDYDNDSDIDVMVVLDCIDGEVDKCNLSFTPIISKICLDEDVLLTCQFCSKEKWEKEQNYLPYYRNILNDGVKIYG